MNNYLGHQFDSGKCVHCGASEKSVRKFQVECPKAISPTADSHAAEGAAVPQVPVIKLTESDTSKTSEHQPVLSKPESATSWQTNRYRDAYIVAKAISTFGNVVKILGLAIGALIVLAGFIATSSVGAEVLWGGILLGIIVAISIYILGLLLSAQGQVLTAALDTAVHTSPFLSKEEKSRIMSL